MSRMRLWSIAITATLSILALFSGQASAKIKFEWQVGGTGTNGTLLAAGQTRAFLTSTDGKTLDFHSNVGGVALLLLSGKVSVTNGKIVGGTPGTGEETVKFEGVKVDPPLAGCTAETGGISNPTPGLIETNLLKSQIVEGETSKEPLMLFTPKTGTVFFSIKLLKNGAEACAIAGATANVEGSFLAQPLPELKETLNGEFDFEARQSFLLSSGGSAETAGLTFGEEPLAIAGLLLNVLETDEKYGAF